MLKCSVRPLITLVLTLVVMGVLSTLCSAREFRNPVGSPTTHVTASVKPRPTTASGEPDQPLSPPPLHITNGVVALPPGDPEADGMEWLFWWARQIWANWLARAPL